MTYAHELARRYNDTLYATNRRRAEEVEWHVNHAGALALRDRPAWSSATRRRQEQKTEAERKRWVHEHQAEHRPFAPPERPEVDIFQPSGAPA